MGARVYLFLDNDEAGRKGTRYIGRALMRGLSVRVCRYETKQPTDLSPEEVCQAALSAQDFFQWALENDDGIR